MNLTSFNLLQQKHTGLQHIIRVPPVQHSRAQRNQVSEQHENPAKIHRTRTQIFQVFYLTAFGVASARG